MAVEQAQLSLLKKAIGQVALVVEDLDQAVENYTRLLGMGPWRFYTYGKPLLRQASYHGEPCDSVHRIALTQVGSLGIELIEAVKSPTIYHDHIEKHGYGLHHVGLLVDDMGEALAEARAAGLEVTQEGSGFGSDGSGHYAYLNTEDLLGMALELIEVPKERYAPERIYPTPQE